MRCRDSRDDAAAVVANGVPMARGKLDDRNLAASQILLIPDVAVGSDELLQVALLWRRQQVAVGQPVPAHIVGSFDLVT
jgi:hypothetical protein